MSAHSETPKRGRPPIEGESMQAVLRLRMTEPLHDFCVRQGTRRLRERLQSWFDEEKAAARLSRTVATLKVRRVAPSTTTVTRIDARIPCGFPSPALDYAEEELNVNDYLLRNPASSFAVEAKGDSMVDAGIFEGDVVFIDRSVRPRLGAIVLAFIDGEFTIKRFAMEKGRPVLEPMNAAANYPVLRPADLASFSIEGVVVGLARQFR